ncbi:MAG: hypothetical protein J7598_03515 [Mitsuaria chitosanitabida]|uniref:hypothetical protein n=1 Tax=Roseateles chitosanitabidus TaxID=65048 RepID=UPI001AFFD1C7|nr:hypothetical protein [Roseateles chitosanitabidus]MBO9685658.1 hypothetical protein [Roseateles chitosanitabidus]
MLEDDPIDATLAARELQQNAADAARYGYDAREALRSANADRAALAQVLFEQHLAPLNANLRALHRLGTTIVWLLASILGLLAVRLLSS